MSWPEWHYVQLPMQNRYISSDATDEKCDIFVSFALKHDCSSLITEKDHLKS